MTIKLVLLKSGEELIADVKEMVVDETNPQVVGYFLNTPCLVSLKTDEVITENTVPQAFKVGMYPWLALSKDKTLPVPADWVVTMAEPIDNVTRMYVEDVLKNGRQNDQGTGTEVAAVDIGAPDCKLVSPYLIKDNEDSPNLEPFLWGVTKETTFMLSSDKILTLCDPSPTLLEKYQDIIK